VSCANNVFQIYDRRNLRSLADQDTDRWIFEVNAPDIRRKMKNLAKEVQWTDLV
jgi:hypothetical protein